MAATRFDDSKPLWAAGSLPCHTSRRPLQGLTGASGLASQDDSDGCLL